MTSHIKANLTKWLIAFIVPVLVWLIPTTAVFSADLRLFFVITVFAMLIIAMELLPTLVASIMLLTLYALSGIVPVSTAFSSWTNTTVWMILGGLIFSNVLDECGLLKRIAYFIITKFGGTFTGAVFGCFTVGIVLNIITFCNGWIVACALVYGVCKAMDLKPGREACLVCFAGTAASCGSTVFLYHPGYVSMLETALNNFIDGYSMSLFTPFIYNGWFALWCIVTILIFLKLFNVKESGLRFSREVFDEKLAEMGPMSRQEKKAVGVVVVLLVYLISCQFTGLPAAYGFMTIPYLMFFPGLDLGSGETIKRTNLSTIFFVAACLSIGSVGNAVGFGDFLTGVAIPLLEGHSKLIVCIAFMIFGMLANLVMTPLAMLGGLAIPFAQVAIALGISPIAAVMILLYTCDMVFLPYEATGNLIMYTYGMMPMKDFIKQEGLKSLVMGIGFICVMYPVWNLLGLM